MNDSQEIRDFLLQHIQSIIDNDLEAYHASTSEELTLYEWWVTPHRIDGLPFHDFMMENNAQRGTVFGSELDDAPEDSMKTVRFDLANLKIQRYGDFAITSYTLLLSTGLPTGVQVASHNESRIMVKIDDNWKVVHVHKSPSWQAPHQQPNK
jgi:hypothetical protein